MIKIIFIGDISGFIGRETVKKILPKIKRKYKPHLIIANAENLAHGKGVTETVLKEMKNAGIDCFTSGNHVFARENAEKILDSGFNLLRPANYPPLVAGEGEKIININQDKILLLNLAGRVFARENFDCPFRCFDNVMEKHKKEKLSGILVDFHAETTSEKKAFFFYADGRATAILGTHTHTQTADEQISRKGTAFISDIGMTGAYDSVIGINKEPVIKTFLTQINYPHELAREGKGLFNAVFLKINGKKKTAVDILRIKEITEIK